MYNIDTTSVYRQGGVSMLKILPSIASADPMALRSEMARVQRLGRLHLDIEDGNFIDNITFGKKTITAIAREFGGTLDAHLMTTDPEAYLPWLSTAGIGSVCGHIEALPYPKRFLANAHSLGMKAGLALNMQIRPEALIPYGDEMDYVLLMTSEPDGADQAFFGCSYSRVAQFRSLLVPGVVIWCDGGICPEHLQKLYNAGMHVAVMGRAVFSADDPAAAIEIYERSVM